MRNQAGRRKAFLTLGLLAGVGLLAGCEKKSMEGSPEKIEDFRLIDHAGKSQGLYRHADAKGVVLIVQGNGCDILRKSVPTINALRGRFARAGLIFLMINANPQDSRASIAREAADYGIDLPILKDEAQVIAQSLGVTRTGEAFLIDPARWEIVYRGAIDDRFGYGTQKSRPSSSYLQDAIQALLAGKPIRQSRTQALGCLISFPPARELSYVKDAAPIFKSKCLDCHGAAAGSTWAMTGYEQIKGWAPMIRESLRTGRMPPWHADPEYGRFSNDISLSSEQLRTLVEWIETGAKRGEGEDPLRGVVSAAAPEWPLGAPDIILKMEREQVIASTGALTWRYVPMTPRLPDGAMIRAIDIRPENKKAVHHSIFYAFAKGLDEQEKRLLPFKGMMIVGGPEREGQLLYVWQPGREPLILPEGMAKIVNGSYPVLEMCYLQSAQEQRDNTRVGVYLYKGPKVPKKVKTMGINNDNFQIPPGAREHEVMAQGVFDRDVAIVAIQVHMHDRGARMRFRALDPAGRSEILLSVPNYAYSWQRIYHLAQPKRLAAGTRIRVEGAFDNSAQNPANPDPGKRVDFGLNADDEMFFSRLFYVEDL